MRPHFRVVCLQPGCAITVYKTKSTYVNRDTPRQIRYGWCWQHRTPEKKPWNHREAPLTVRVGLALLLLATPASAQSRVVSDLAVWSAIGLDTVASARADDRRDAFTCQGLRMGITLGAAELTKRIVSRERPDGSDRKSFYSMHTAMAGQAAGWRYQVGIPLTALTAWGRVQSKRHYWTDVAVGMLAGLAASRMCGDSR